MITSNNISKQLKTRANAIADAHLRNIQSTSALLKLVGVIFIVGGFIISLFDFEYLWYVFIMGVFFGCLCISYGVAVGKNTEIPVNALELFAYGEIIDRMNQPGAVVPAAPQATKAAPAAQPVAAPTKPSAPKATKHSWRCPQCSSPVSSYPCPTCGYKTNNAPYICGNCGNTGPYDGNCPKCGSSIKFYKQ